MQLARAPMMIRDFPARVEDYLEWLKFPVVNSSTGVILTLIYLLLHFGGLFKRPDFWEYRPTRAIISLSSFHLIICQSDLEVIFSRFDHKRRRVTVCIEVIHEHRGLVVPTSSSDPMVLIPEMIQDLINAYCSLSFAPWLSLNTPWQVLKMKLGFRSIAVALALGVTVQADCPDYASYSLVCPYTPERDWFSIHLRPTDRPREYIYGPSGSTLHEAWSRVPNFQQFCCWGVYNRR